MTTQNVSKFRPCIDLHQGKVKQIVGGTLNQASPAELKTNFVAEEPSEYYAQLYKENDLKGAHVIKLGPNNDEAAKSALKTWPNGLQIGGGITIENAKHWLELGASKVIVTSWLFTNNQFDLQKLVHLSETIGKDNLVLDLSCRKVGNGWNVAINKWQTITSMKIDEDTLKSLEQYCSEFLIHAADVEGLCKGIDTELIEKLGQWVSIPTTYAGGAYRIEDLQLINQLSKGKVDLTFGSALDIFGGDKVKFQDCVEWNQSN